MRIWLIQLGEPLPIDGPVRLYRTGVLASMLAERGHDVTWWAGTFDHAHKKQRYEHDCSIRLDSNCRIELIHARGYKQNVSLSRVLYHRQIAHKFSRRIRHVSPPDIILSSLPTPDLSKVAVDYGRRRDIPVVIDVRDHWPDIFMKVVPGGLRWLARLALWPAFRTNHRIFGEAAGITAISNKQLEWGLGYARRPRRRSDRVFHMGYPRLPVSPPERQQAEDFWMRHRVRKSGFNCCFFGAISLHFDLETIILAARELEASDNDEIRFVLCGDGSRLDYYRRFAENLSNVLFPGWVNAAAIAVLLEWSKVGLAPYSAEEESMAMPNKPFEYFYGELPVLSSLRGELENLLVENDCGLTYETENVQSFLDSLLELYNNPQRRQAMGKRARRLFKERFSAERVYSGMIDYLELIAEGKLGA